MNVAIEQTPEFIALTKGIKAYNTGCINKQKLNRLYEAVINNSILFFEKRTTAIIALPKVTRKHGVMLRRALRHSA